MHSQQELKFGKEYDGSKGNVGQVPYVERPILNWLSLYFTSDLCHLAQKNMSVYISVLCV